MPEYLSPGVFIEEVPARLKAIEGVSTSTAGFAGISERGPEAGFDPFAGSANPPLLDFKSVLDPTPVLVTSFAEFARLFGTPPADPAKNGYLAHAAQAFFNNGGKRLFVARATPSDAAAASIRTDTGALLRLTKQPQANTDELFLNSLRGLGSGGGANITFKDITTGAGIVTLDIVEFRPQSQSIVVSPALDADGARALDPSRVYAEVQGVLGGSFTGPQFVARSRGLWGSNLRVTIACSDRPAVRVTADSSTDFVQVASTSTFYRGAVVQVCTPANNEPTVVLDVLPSNVMQLSAAVGVAAATDFLRVAEIDVTIVDQVSGATEVFRGLSWNASPDPDVRRRHYSSVINARSRLAYCQPPWGGLDVSPAAEETPTFDNMPMTPRASPLALTGGDNGTLDDLTTLEPRIVGTDAGPGKRSGIQSLQDVEDVRIIAAPGFTGVSVQNELITQCERLRYRFAVLDGEEEPLGGAVTSILTHRNAYSTAFAAYYVPWVEILDGDNRILLPPSGHVAGIYARVDTERGVHKAPANEVLRGITGLASYITTGEQDILNPRGVNAIRRFEGRGIRVWGARTLADDSDNRYVNVRRYLIFLEASLDRGTQFVVFEPNAPETWSRVVDSVTAFLHSQWRNGALFGRRPEDAFFVRCDETTMSADDILNGRLICQIGVAIVRPAEFVIFRIEQISGFAAQP